MGIKLFYVEDEPSIGKIVNDVLKLQGFEVLWEKDGAAALAQVKSFTPDICVLDIMLPNVDGYEICKSIRKQFPTMPIIFLSAKTTAEDVVKGFDAGGTEYIRKPFSIEELVVRIKNQLKLSAAESNTKPAKPNEVPIASFTFLPMRYELVAADGGITKLSSREGELLTYMVEKRGQIIDRKAILLSIWKDDSIFHSRNLDVYIKKLRDHFKTDPNVEIQTLRGRGYLFLVSG